MTKYKRVTESLSIRIINPERLQGLLNVRSKREEIERWMKLRTDNIQMKLKIVV